MSYKIQNYVNAQIVHQIQKYANTQIQKKQTQKDVPQVLFDIQHIPY